MRVIILAFTILFTAQAYCLAQPPRRYERALKRNSEQKYLVYVPQNYDPKKAYPLLIAMHRKGGPASDQVDQWGFSSNRDHYVLLAPEFFGGFQFFRSDEDRELIAMMREMKDEFRYDPKKVFIVGFSIGGDFVQNFVFEHPNYITAAAIIAARNYREPSGKGRQVDYFVSVGANDAVSAQPAREFVQQMRSKGYAVQFKEFPSLGFALNDDVKNTVMNFFKKL